MEVGIVQMGVPSPQPPAPRKPILEPQDPLAPNRVFVGGLHAKADETALRAHFEEKFGPVISCKIIHDKETGKSKGYGFVTFVSADTAEQVRQLGTVTFMDKAANVGHAVRKPSPPSMQPRPSGGAGPRSGGGGGDGPHYQQAEGGNGGGYAGRNGYQNNGGQNGYVRDGPPRRNRKYNNYHRGYHSYDVANGVNFYNQPGSFLVPVEYFQQLQQQMFMAQLYQQPPPALYQPYPAAPMVPYFHVVPGGAAYEVPVVGNDRGSAQQQDPKDQPHGQDGVVTIPVQMNGGPVAALTQQMGAMVLGPQQGQIPAPRAAYAGQPRYTINHMHPAYHPLAQPAAPAPQPVSLQ